MLVLGIASMVVYFKVIDYRSQVICTTDNRKINLNFGKIDGVSVLYYDNKTTFIYFDNQEVRDEFVKILGESEYFDRIYREVDYHLIKDGYDFNFSTDHPSFIVCYSYKRT